MEPNRIFAGVRSTGISYADRGREVHGDYAPLAFLSFDTLALRFERNCPFALRSQIEADAAVIQARRGERFAVSACGQTVTLGA